MRQRGRGRTGEDCHNHPREGSSLDPLESGMGGRKKRVSVTEPGQVLDAVGLRKASLRG